MGTLKTKKTSRKTNPKAFNIETLNISSEDF